MSNGREKFPDIQIEDEGNNEDGSNSDESDQEPNNEESDDNSEQTSNVTAPSGTMTQASDQGGSLSKSETMSNGRESFPDIQIEDEGNNEDGSNSDESDQEPNNEESDDNSEQTSNVTAPSGTMTQASDQGGSLSKAKTMSNGRESFPDIQIEDEGNNEDGSNSDESDQEPNNEESDDNSEQTSNVTAPSGTMTQASDQGGFLSKAETMSNGRESFSDIQIEGEGNNEDGSNSDESDQEPNNEESDDNSEENSDVRTPTETVTQAIDRDRKRKLKYSKKDYVPKKSRHYEPQSEASEISSQTSMEPDFVSTKLTDLQKQELKKQFSFIETNEKIKEVMILLHEWSHKSQTFKRPCRCDKNCIFCDVHFVEMMKEKYVVEFSCNKICEQKDVVYLVFCIFCDKVWIGFSKRQVANLADFNYGFCGKNICDMKQNHNKKSLRCMIIDENESTLSEWVEKLCVKAKLPPVGQMSNKKYKLNLSEDPKLSLCFKQHRLFSERIIYLMQCNECKLFYVGRTENTFKKRYPNFFSKNYTVGAFHKHTVEENSQCTDQDLRWTVIDSLSDDQIYFLDKWKYVFNKCDIEEKKKMLVIVEDVTTVAVNEASKIVWEDLPIDEKINRIKNLKLSDMAKSKLIKIEGGEEKLMIRNNTLITKTKERFLEIKEKFWFDKIKYSGYKVFNKIEPSQSPTKCLYTTFFETLQI